MHPFFKSNLEIPKIVNPMRSMPALQMGRSIDTIPDAPPAGGGGGGGATAGIEPFDITFSAGSDSVHTKATIQPGTINGLIPSNYATTYDLSITGTYYLVLSPTSTSGAITGAALSMPTSPPSALPVLMGSPPASFDYLLGVVVNGVWFRTIGPGSLFGTGSEVFRVSKTSPAPGTLPYDIYYTWLISNA